MEPKIKVEWNGAKLHYDNLDAYMTATAKSKLFNPAYEWVLIKDVVTYLRAAGIDAEFKFVAVDLDVLAFKGILEHKYSTGRANVYRLKPNVEVIR